MLRTKKSRQFRFRACARCNGDAYLDDSYDEAEWRCLQCSRTVPLITQPAFALVEDEQQPLAA